MHLCLAKWHTCSRRPVLGWRSSKRKRNWSKRIPLKSSSAARTTTASAIRPAPPEGTTPTRARQVHALVTWPFLFHILSSHSYTMCFLLCARELYSCVLTVNQPDRRVRWGKPLKSSYIIDAISGEWPGNSSICNDIELELDSVEKINYGAFAEIIRYEIDSFYKKSVHLEFEVFYGQPQLGLILKFNCPLFLKRRMQEKWKTCL